MDHLIDNASKFTTEGGTIRLALSVHVGQAVITVTESGIGIPPDDEPQIFKRFHRGRKTNTDPGSGLGLAIVKANAVTHGGTVDVQSAGEGKGSQFFVRLPCLADLDRTTS